MINVTVGNNMKRTTVAVDSETTLRQVFEENGIDYGRGLNSLDGAPLQPGDLDRTFADFGVAEKTFLFSTVKADNA